MLAQRHLARALQRSMRSAPTAARTYATSSADGPMSFGLTDEQRAIQELATSFSRDKIVPAAAELDRTMEYPWELIKEAHSLGLLNGHIPAEYGGSGLGVLDCSIISEQMAYGCSGVGTAMEACGLAEAPLIVGASDAIKKKYLGRMTEEPLVASYAVTEPSAGSDVANIKTKAVKEGDKWVINGTKMWITNSGHANWFFVLAITDPTQPAHKSMTGFVVDGDNPGVKRGRKEINMGQRCSDTRMVTFEDVVVGEENVVGKPGEGFKIAMKVFDITRPLVAASAVGVAQRALEEATKYAQTRETMGTAIVNHQAVGFMLADMAINAEAARGLVQKAAWTKDIGQRNSVIAAMAKCFASKAAVENADLGVQVFGGIGYNTETPMEKLYRDAKIFELYEGTSQIQRLIISRQLPSIYPA